MTYIMMNTFLVCCPKESGSEEQVAKKVEINIFIASQSFPDKSSGSFYLVNATLK